MLEQLPLLQELYGARGRAPGVDGPPVCFFKIFLGNNGQGVAVINDSLTGGLLPLSCRRVVSTLLPKKRDPREIKNLGSVALLCTDDKILSKVLVNGLRKVMGQITHADQSYRVPCRSIIRYP